MGGICSTFAVGSERMAHDVSVEHDEHGRQEDHDEFDGSRWELDEMKRLPKGEHHIGAHGVVGKTKDVWVTPHPA